MTAVLTILALQKIEQKDYIISPEKFKPIMFNATAMELATSCNVPLVWFGVQRTPPATFQNPIPYLLWLQLHALMTAAATTLARKQTETRICTTSPMPIQALSFNVTISEAASSCHVHLDRLGMSTNTPALPQLLVPIQMEEAAVHAQRHHQARTTAQQKILALQKMWL